jgi:hypothetical protein
MEWVRNLQIVNQEQYSGELITPTLTDFRDNSPKIFVPGCNFVAIQQIRPGETPRLK